MHDNTLYPNTSKVLDLLQEQSFLSNFYLAGGTALALQLGHRKSIDLDFFTAAFPSQEILVQYLSVFKPTITQQDAGTIDVYIQDVKVSFLQYPYPLINSLLPYKNIHIASILDIACMKISAISSRGSKKDFVDLYFILQMHTLEEVFTAFSSKFADTKYQIFHLLKSLVYFADAEADPNPDFLVPIGWDVVKSTLESQVLAFTQNV